jgi:hypothetical protein
MQQQLIEIAIAAAGSIRSDWSAGGQSEHSALAPKDAGIVRTACVVGESHSKDAIHPALQNRGEGEPPQRKLEEHEISPCELVDFSLKLWFKGSLLGRMFLLSLIAEGGFVRARQKVVRPAGSKFMAYRSETCTAGPAPRSTLVDRSFMAPLKDFGSGCA